MEQSQRRSTSRGGFLRRLLVGDVVSASFSRSPPKKRGSCGSKAQQSIDNAFACRHAHQTGAVLPPAAKLPTQQQLNAARCGTDSALVGSAVGDTAARGVSPGLNEVSKGVSLQGIQTGLARWDAEGKILVERTGKPDLFSLLEMVCSSFCCNKSKESGERPPMLKAQRFSVFAANAPGEEAASSAADDERYLLQIQTMVEEAQSDAMAAQASLINGMRKGGDEYRRCSAMPETGYFIPEGEDAAFQA
jgi:hypothetical protein